MFMLREGSLVLLTAMVAVTAGLGISRLVDTAPYRPDGLVMIHGEDGGTQVATPAPTLRMAPRLRPDAVGY